MKKGWFGLLAAILLGVPAQAQSINPLEFEVLSPEWQASEVTPLYAAFDNLVDHIRLYIYTDPLVSNGGCQVNAPVKDVAFEVVVYQQDAFRTAVLSRALDKMKLKVIKGKRTTGVNAMVVDRYDLKNTFANEEVMRLGKVRFTSPYSCQGLDESEFEISGIKIGGVVVPSLDVRMKFLEP